MSRAVRELSVLVLAASLSTTGCSRVAAKSEDAATAEIPVRAARAAIQDVPLDIAAVGNVEAINSVDVKSRVAGPIARVAFAEGENVTKGQLLFTIDRSMMDRQAAEEQALVERDSALEEQAQATVARDAASARQSRSEAGVAVQLGQLGVLSGQRVDEMTTARDTAGAGLASDKASLAAAQSALKADRARLAQTELQQSFSNVIAPLSGRAGAVRVKTGNMVRDNDTTLVTLLQLAPIDVAFGVPEQSLAEIQRLSARGPLTVDATLAGGTHAAGRIAFIDNTVDAATGAIRLKAVFPNGDGALWPGEFVHVRVRLRMDAAKTVIPDSCVEEGLNGKYVWAIDQGHATMTPVSVARVYAAQNGPALAVISAGIRPGDLVVTEGQLRLTAGTRVSILDAAGTPPTL